MKFVHTRKMEEKRARERAIKKRKRRTIIMMMRMALKVKEEKNKLLKKLKRDKFLSIDYPLDNIQLVKIETSR